ncbi:hypothetical protein [Iriri virus]|uniref:Uncharacterized protein n=1 Tax=Iriri virus TaxID=1620893 RepID=A0A0D3R1K3_9RHAB|nr:hypothetical protein [Iriri virus]AJR28382.1 hypothetical protein [Iriri virus]
MKSLADWLSKSTVDGPVFITKMFKEENGLIDFYLDLYLEVVPIGLEVRFCRSVVEPLHVIFIISP